MIRKHVHFVGPILCLIIKWKIIINGYGMMLLLKMILMMMFLFFLIVMIIITLLMLHYEFLSFFHRVFGLVNLYILNQNYKCMDKKREILSFELMCTVFGHHVSKLGGFSSHK